MNLCSNIGSSTCKCIVVINTNIKIQLPLLHSMPLVPCMAKELQPRSLTASTSALANNEATIGFVHHVTD